MSNSSFSTDLIVDINAVVLVWLVIIAVLIVTLNLFSIQVIQCTDQLHATTRYLMTSLACADISVGVTTLIPLIYAAFSDTLIHVACEMMGLVSSVSWVVSVYTLCFLTIDRYLAIVFPLKYQYFNNKFYYVGMIAAPWLFSILLWVLPLANIGGYKFNADEVACYFDVAGFPVQWILYMVIIFLPTSGVTLWCYCHLYAISAKHNRFISEQSGQVEQQNNYKALRTIVITVGAFYLAWAPFVIEHIVKAVKGKLDEVPEWLEISIFIVAVTNSFWNPIIYIGTNVHYRNTARKILAKYFSCFHANRVTQSESSNVNVSTIMQDRDEIKI